MADEAATAASAPVASAPATAPAAPKAKAASAKSKKSGIGRGSSLGNVFSKGLLTENPVLRQTLGMCPTLAVSTAVSNGIGMGLATTFVLVCSGVAISALRKVIPDSVRIPAFITVIASFVTLIMMLIQAYLPALNDALGIYLPLIVVNCIVLGRAEVYASKHSVVEAAVDGLGMGLGFTIAIVAVSAVRELLGAGTLLGFQVMPDSFEPMIVMVTPAGAFLVLGVLIALSVWYERRRQLRAGQEPEEAPISPCAACPLDCALAGSATETPADAGEAAPCATDGATQKGGEA